MDIADLALEQSDLDLKLALDNCKRPNQIKNTGKCGYCKDPIKCGQFCDTDCRDDYERMVSL